MSALVLAFVACLSGSCRMVQIPWDGGLQACMLFGQQTAAEWLAQHPGHTMQRGYRCETGRET